MIECLHTGLWVRGRIVSSHWDGLCFVPRVTWCQVKTFLLLHLLNWIGAEHGRCSPPCQPEGSDAQTHFSSTRLCVMGGVRLTNSTWTTEATFSSCTHPLGLCGASLRLYDRMIMFTAEVNVCWRTDDAQLDRNNVAALEPKRLCTFLLSENISPEMLMLKLLPDLLMSNQVKVMNSKAQKRNVG